MVNKEIISPLPLLYLYLSFPILIIIVTTTTIYPSLTLRLLYLFNFRAPFFSAQQNSHYYFFTFSPNLFTLHPSLSLPFRSFLFLSHSFFFFFLFRGLLSFFCTPVSRRISDLTGASFW